MGSARRSNTTKPACAFCWHPSRAVNSRPIRRSRGCARYRLPNWPTRASTITATSEPAFPKRFSARARRASKLRRSLANSMPAPASLWRRASYPPTAPRSPRRFRHATIRFRACSPGAAWRRRGSASRSSPPGLPTVRCSKKRRKFSKRLDTTSCGAATSASPACTACYPKSKCSMRARPLSWSPGWTARSRALSRD